MQGSVPLCRFILMGEFSHTQTEGVYVSMNRELFRLAIQGLGRKKKSSLSLFLVLFLSFTFSIITLSVNGSTAETTAQYKRDVYGEWDGAILCGTEKDVDFLQREDWLSELAVLPQAGGVASLHPITGKVQGTMGGIGVWDEKYGAMGHLTLQDGRFPETKDEIVLEDHVLDNLGYDYDLGQQIILPVQFSAGNHEVVSTAQFTLCGVLRRYTNLWELDYYGNEPKPTADLDAAFVTEEGAAALWEKAVAAAAETEKALEQETGMKQKVTLDGETFYYFFTAKLGMIQAMKNQVSYHQRVVKAPSPGVTLNGGSWEASEEANYNAVYTVLIFAATLLSVLCVYAVQLQRQVRQIALFRSIGATRRQLGVLLFWETLCLCAPAALLGTAVGWLGTWLALRVLLHAAGVPVIVVIPWRLVAPLLLVWALAVFGARLFILGLAMREPLTGRMAMANKKSQRYRRLRTYLVSLLSVLLGVVVLFAGLELLRHGKQMEYWASLPSYEITRDFGYTVPVDFAYWYPRQVITPEHIARFREVPSVTKVDVRIELGALPYFDGIEEIEYFQQEPTEQDVKHGRNPWIERKMGVNVYVLPEENWADHLDLERIGVDIDAFREGEQVVLSFPAQSQGQYVFYNDMMDDTIRQIVTDVGIKTGDRLALDFYSHLDSQGQPGGLLKHMEVTVGGIQILDAVQFDVQEYGLLGRYPYTVWCSEDFARKFLSDIPMGTVLSLNEVFGLQVGSDFGYSYADIYTDQTADYLSTDVTIARLMNEFGLYQNMNSSSRGYKDTRRQEEQQTVVLLSAGGGCLCLVLLLILANTLAAEAEQERRHYGILQSLGMSRKQMGARLLRTALFRGLASAAAGWLVFGGFLLFSIWSTVEQSDGLSWERAARDTLMDYYGAGVNIWLVLALTLGVTAFVMAVTLLSKRHLFQENLMTKLREEQ